MKEFELEDKVKITNCNTNKMVGVEGTIVCVSAKDDLFNYLLRISTDDYKDVGWRIAEGYGCADIPYGLVADYEDDDRYTFWWATASSLEHIKDEETTADNEDMQHDIQKQIDEIVDKVGIAVGADKDTKYHDTHYKSCAIEPIEVMQVLLSKEQFKGFLLGNALKYRLRAGHKDNALSDIDKAVRYEQWLKEFEETGEITL